MEKGHTKTKSQSLQLSVAVVFTSVSLCLAAPLWAQNTLDNPQPGSFQSGIGVISGWVCEVTEQVEIQIDEGPRLRTAYGTTRGDTLGLCGDTDNGFGLTWNWNLVGDGEHRLRAFADGSQFADVTFTVTTFGTVFLEGVSGGGTINDFPDSGDQVDILWQQNLQNFVITTGSGSGGGSSSDGMKRALDNPQPGSFQSGIGVISGWICEVTEQVEIQIDEGPRLRAAYGTTRGDTLGSCSDINNGFGLSWNWNLVGDGEHRLRAFADGSQFADVTFTVTTLGLVFLEGVSGGGAINDFPEAGSSVEVRWQQSLQNFIIARVQPLPKANTLTVKKKGTGNGTVMSDPAGIDCGLDCENAYPIGTLVTLTAVPGENSTFDGWSGDTDCEDGRVTMTTNLNCTATFTSEAPDATSSSQGVVLTVEKEGSGRVISTPRGIDCGSDCSEDYEQGVTVTLTAMTSEDSIFEWSGDADCADGQVIMTTNRTCTVVFSKLPQLTVELPDQANRLAFGRVFTGSLSEDRHFTVRNDGGGTLRGSLSISPEAREHFTLATDSFMLGPGKEQVATVTFNPKIEGNLVGVVTVASENGDRHFVNLEGIGDLGDTFVLFCCDGAAVLTLGDNSNSPTVPGNVLDFGSIRVDESSELSFAVRNAGFFGTLVGSIFVSNSANDSFSLGTGMPQHFRLEPDQTQPVTVYFRPTGVGSFNGFLSVSARGFFRDSGVIDLRLSGIGVGSFMLSPGELDFGVVEIGRSRNLTFAIENDSGGRLDGSVSTAFPFSIISGGSFSLGADESQPVTIRFSPDSVGSFDDSVHIMANNGEESRNVSLFGTGIPQVPLVVNSTADAVDASPGDGRCESSSGECTPRAAIQEANALPGSNTINLSAGTYVLNIDESEENTASSGDLDIIGDLTIIGEGARTTIIDGGDIDRVFDIIGASTISAVTVQNGKGNSGGGIRNRGTLTLTNSTVSGNEASTSGGGIFNSGTLELTTSTISGNEASTSGGGIFNSGTLELTNSTISGNSALDGGGLYNFVGSTTRLRNTIIANNLVVDCSGSVISLGNNLDSDATCNLPTEGDLPNTDPFLGPLQDNGGPTFTHALLVGSMAIDTGNPNGCLDATNVLLTIDQRGFARPVDGNGDREVFCDIGAYEATPLALPSVTVTTTADNGMGSLRRAIFDVTDGGSIDFAASLANQTINLSSELFIDKDLTIIGLGKDNLHISGNMSSRVFHIAQDAVVTISDVTIENGVAEDGGGISNRGILELTNIIIRNNLADNSGGGIWNVGDNAILELKNVTLSNNAATNTGGGIFNGSGAIATLFSATIEGGAASFCGGIWNDGLLELINTTVQNNVTGTRGSGGICNHSAVTLTDSTINDNRGDLGGGIRNESGTVHIINSTISGNSAVIAGGIGNESGTVHTTNSNISGNDADFTGGGIWNNGELTIANSTISGNNTGGFFRGGGIRNALDGTVTLTHTIVAGNTAADGPDCMNSGETLNSLGHNLVGVGTGCPSGGPSDQTVDPTDVFTTVLGPLQNNGGSTETHALLLGSPAIDTGDVACTDIDGEPLTTDQRGALRPQGAACDIGAYEFP